MKTTTKKKKKKCFTGWRRAKNSLTYNHTHTHTHTYKKKKKTCIEGRKANCWIYQLNFTERHWKVKLVGLLQKSLRKKKSHKDGDTPSRPFCYKKRSRKERKAAIRKTPARHRYTLWNKIKKKKEEELLVDVPRDVSSENLPVPDSAPDRSSSLIL